MVYYTGEQGGSFFFFFLFFLFSPSPSLSFTPSLSVLGYIDGKCMSVCPIYFSPPPPIPLSDTTERSLYMHSYCVYTHRRARAHRHICVLPIIQPQASHRDHLQRQGSPCPQSFPSSDWSSTRHTEGTTGMWNVVIMAYRNCARQHKRA